MKTLAQLRMEFDATRDRYNDLRRTAINSTDHESLAALTRARLEFNEATTRYCAALMKSTDPQ